MSTTATAPPSIAIRRTVWLPIPAPAPPVTRATLFSKSFGMLFPVRELGFERRRSGVEADETALVVAHDEARGLGPERLAAVRELDGVGQAFRMREVRAEDDVLRPDQAAQVRNVFLVVGRDVDVPAENLARTARPAAADPRPVAAHALHLVHRLEQVRYPEAAVLDADHLDVRKAAEQVVKD